MKSSKAIDDYLTSFSGETLEKLQAIRAIIKKLAPDAKEKMSYGIPTFEYGGKNLVHFAGYKTHIGFYPGSLPIKQFEKELSGYKTSKGTVQFRLDAPLPVELITKIVTACVEKNKVKHNS